MARKKGEKAIAFENAQKEVLALLSTLEPIEYEKGVLYIANKEFYETLLTIDDTISIYKTDSKRGKIFGIDSIIKIINPDKFAINYHLTTAFKSKLITDKGKIIDRLAAEKEVSKNKILKAAKDIIENNKLDEFEAKLKMDEANKKVNKEKQEFEKISSSPDDYELIISTFVERIAYPQVNWNYLDKENKQRKTNAHVSTKKPSVLIIDENSIADDYRTDMQVARFIKDGYRAFGDVYAKPIKEDK
jgi:hypothetical protein